MGRCVEKLYVLTATPPAWNLSKMKIHHSIRLLHSWSTKDKRLSSLCNLSQTAMRAAKATYKKLLFVWLL
jgi:hypothetical protein